MEKSHIHSNTVLTNRVRIAWNIASWSNLLFSTHSLRSTASTIPSSYSAIDSTGYFMGKLRPRYLAVLFLANGIGVVQSQTLLTIDGVDKCLSSGLDWYINAVGETPCRTYQRLRQICNPVYKVQPFFSTTPGDTCNEQLSRCCCNSVSWALSMLCMNCQAGAGLPTLTNGIDAGVGAYRMYRGTCGAGVNQTIPADVQAGVCTQKIDIRPSLYGLFWGDGAWFYAYTSQAFTLESNKLPQANLTNCPSTSTSSASTTSTQPISGTITPPVTSETSPSQPASPNTGAIAGGVAGGIAALIAIAIFVWWFLRRRRNKGTVDLLGGQRTSREMAPVTPFVVTGQLPSPDNEHGIGSIAYSQRHRNKPGAAMQGGFNSASMLIQPHTTGPYSNGTGSQAGGTYTSASTTTGSDLESSSMQPSAFVARRPRPEKSVASHPQGTPLMLASHSRISEDRTAVPERHEDAGISLARSDSGRLPPAYPSA